MCVEYVGRPSNPLIGKRNLLLLSISLARSAESEDARDLLCAHVYHPFPSAVVASLLVAESVSMINARERHRGERATLG